MDNESVTRQRQHRSRGKCWGCGREGVELLSSVWADGAAKNLRCMPQGNRQPPRARPGRGPRVGPPAERAPRDKGQAAYSQHPAHGPD
jgi:hypothetical protein